MVRPDIELRLGLARRRVPDRLVNALLRDAENLLHKGYRPGVGVALGGARNAERPRLAADDDVAGVHSVQGVGPGVEHRAVPSRSERLLAGVLRAEVRAVVGLVPD